MKLLRRWPAWRLASSKPIRVGFLDEKPSSYAAGCGVHVPQVFFLLFLCSATTQEMMMAMMIQNTLRTQCAYGGACSRVRRSWCAWAGTQPDGQSSVTLPEWNPESFRMGSCRTIIHSSDTDWLLFLRWLLPPDTGITHLLY